MKLHRVLIQTVVSTLQSVFEDGRYADKILEKTFHEKRQLGARDRRFIAESVYDIVRWWRLLTFVLDGEKDLWRIFAVWWIRKGNDLPDWKEWEGINTKLILSRLKDPQMSRAIRESIPDWMDEVGFRELGSNWNAALTALNQIAPVVLRTNTLKTDPQALAKILEREGFPVEPVGAAVPDGVRLLERANVFKSAAFKQGFFEVQDSASQLVAPFSQVSPGEKVVDACAGAGGKALHMAALMKNKGKILALDVAEWKLQELRKRASRDGVDIIEVRTIDSTKVIKRLEGTADCLLLDVPCSGLGVLRRNPDAKWKLTLEKLASLHGEQRKILADYKAIVKKGGRLVYSTCSLLPSENEVQVKWFLDQFPGEFELVDQKSVLPQEAGFDGFFMALMRRVK